MLFLNIKNILFKFVPIIISIIYLILFLISIKNYNGNILIYFLYNLLVVYYFLFSFIKSELFFDKFLSLLIFLGFGVKLVLSFYLMGHLAEVSNFLLKSNGFSKECHMIKECIPAKNALIFGGYYYDNGLIVVITAMSALILMSSLSRYIIKDKFYLNNLHLDTNVYYSKFRVLIIVSVIIFSLLISMINYNFNIFQKGIVSTNIIKPVFTWLLSFGLVSFFCLLAYLEVIRKKNDAILIVCISIFIIFLNNVSSLSRAMIFNSSSLIFALIKIKPNYKIFKITLILFVISTLFITSLYLSKELRHNKYADVQVSGPQTTILKNEKKASLINFIEYVEHIFLYRWIGITEVIQIASKEGDDPDLFKKFILENNKGKISHFDKLMTKNYTDVDRKKFNHTSVPGIIAFLYTSNSLLVVFWGISFLYLFCVSLEYFAFFLSKGNVFLSSLIGQILAYRLIHFGVNTSQSYKFLFAVIFTIILISIITHLFLNKKSDNYN